MAKYHISPKTGQPNICRAHTKPCPVGGENEHFATKEEARTAFEKTMKSEELKTSKKPKTYSQQDVKDWEDLRETEEMIEQYNKNAQYSLIARSHLEKANEAIKKARETYTDPVQLSGGGLTVQGPWPSYTRTALDEVHKSTFATYGAHSSPSDRILQTTREDLDDIAADIDIRRTENAMDLQHISDRLDNYEAHKSELEAKLVERTGFKENPKYGVPSGVTTKEKYHGKQASGYSKLPSKDVDVLENSERFCTKCDDKMTYVQSGYSGGWLHSSTSGSYCGPTDGGDDKPQIYGSVNSECRYCGTGNPAHLKFEMKSYSDETSCSRCGGVSGYGIGD